MSVETEVKTLGELNLEELKNQKTPLTEEQTAAIAKAATDEAEAEEKGAVKAEDKEKKEKEEKTVAAKEKKEEGEISDEELIQAKDEDLTDEQKTKKQGLVKIKEKAENERILNAKEEELSAEDKAKKVELVKAQDTEKQKALDEELNTYAKDNKISVEEAKRDLESISKIQEKYKNDPKHLAKAFLFIQRYAEKSKTDIETMKKQLSVTPPPELKVDDVIKAIDDGKLKDSKGKVLSQEDIVSAYREQNPDTTEEVADEKVLRMAAKEIRERAITNMQEQAKAKEVELSKAAQEKKTTLLNSLNEDDKKFLPDIQPVMDKLSPAHIASDDFSMEDMIRWARGGHYSEDVKTAEERGYTRGKEEAKILGEKSNQPGGGGSSKTKKEGEKKAGAKLTEDQKKRALSMYGEVMSEEKAYEAFEEYLKEEK